MTSQSQMAAENPFAFGHLLNTISMQIEKPLEIVILNTENKSICKSLYTSFIPSAVMVAIQNQQQLDALNKYSFFAGKKFELQTKVTVCKDFTCSPQLSTIKDIQEYL